MRHCPFCDKKCVNFGIKLDAEISIWMQSGFDGFDFSATLAVNVDRAAGVYALVIHSAKVFVHHGAEDSVADGDGLLNILWMSILFNSSFLNHRCFS